MTIRFALTLNVIFASDKRLANTEARDGIGTNSLKLSRAIRQRIYVSSSSVWDLIVFSSLNKNKKLPARERVSVKTRRVKSESAIE